MQIDRLMFALRRIDGKWIQAPGTLSHDEGHCRKIDVAGLMMEASSGPGITAIVHVVRETTVVDRGLVGKIARLDYKDGLMVSQRIIEEEGEIVSEDYRPG